jgi:hypothetical protein
MRIAVLVTMSLLVGGCSHATGGLSRQADTSSTSAGVSATTVTSPTMSIAPKSGTPISGVIGWIEAGHPADAARYHSATRDGVSTGLGADIAFTVGAVTCMTDSTHTSGVLACLVDLADPPPRPTTIYSEWKGGWVDFDGSSLHVGSARGDPGPFINGKGPELAYGDSLSFGDFRCRADQVDLFCVNYAHRSAVRFAASGIEPFGCLRSTPPPEGVGQQFSC